MGNGWAQLSIGKVLEPNVIIGGPLNLEIRIYPFWNINLNAGSANHFVTMKLSIFSQVQTSPHQQSRRFQGISELQRAKYLKMRTKEDSPVPDLSVGTCKSSLQPRGLSFF